MRNTTNIGQSAVRMAFRKQFSPLRLLIVLIVAIFLAEVIAMVIVLALEPMPYQYLTLLDATIMMVLIFPVVYYLSLRPLIRHIEWRRQAEQALQQMNETLEQRVAERTVELRESEERFRSALDNMLEGCQIVGFDWRYIYVNDVAASHIQRTKERLLGSTIMDIYPDIEKTSVFDLMRRCMDKRVPSHIEDEFTFPDGWQGWFELSIQPVPEGIFILSMDITNRKRAEKALLNANDELELRVRERTKELAVANQELINEIYEREDVERQLRIQTTAMEAAANGIVITAPDGEIMWTNPAFTRISGYTQDELIGQNIRLLKSGEHEPDYYRQMWATILAGDVWQGEMINRRKDGSAYIEEQTITPVLDEGDQISFFIAIKNDITHQKQIQAELELERTRLESILDTMPDGVYIINQNYDIEYINPVIEREFGVVDGQKCYEYFHNLEEPCSWCKNEEVFAGTTFIREQTYSKNTKSYEIFDAPLANADGTTSKLKLLHDITQRRKMELDLEQSNLELQIASNAERNQRQFAEALVAAALNLNKSQNLDEVLKIILEQIKEVIPYQFASIGLLNGESFYEAGHYGDADFVADRLNNVKPDFLDNIPILDKMRQSNQPILIPDTQQESSCMDIENFEWCRSFLSTPLIVDEKMIGTVNLFDGRVGFFTQEMCERLMAFAAHAAIAIQNAWLFEQVRASSERLQSLSRRLVEVQEAERVFISRELHDEAGQMLTSLMVDLQLLEKNVSNPDMVMKKINEMGDSLIEIQENLHRVAMALHPASLDHLGLVPAIQQYVESIGEKNRLKVSFRSEGVQKRLSSNVETALYRIIQEALTNIIRHAHATRVDVVLVVRDGKLVVIIEDDGNGFNPEEVSPGEHLGILSMRERAEMIDGNLIIESTPGEGTTVMVEVIYDNPIVDRG